MGSAISEHLNAGHAVHVVLATDGINSGVRSELGLSRTEFARARDGELRRACLALGVPASNIHVSRFAAEDGALSVGRARDVLLDWLERYPGARVKTHTDRGMPHGQHPDHAHLGQAAVQLYDEGVFTDLRLYVEPYELEEFTDANGDITSPERTSTPEAVRAAIDEYRREDHDQGMYGIGYRSVPDYFDALDADPVSHVHVP